MRKKKSIKVDIDKTTEADFNLKMTNIQRQRDGLVECTIFAKPVLAIVRAILSNWMLDRLQINSSFDEFSDVIDFEMVPVP